MSSNYETRLFINGSLQNAQSGATFDVKSPATNEVIAKMAAAGKADIDQAVSAAKKAQPAWARKSAYDRANILRRFAQLVYESSDKLGQLDAAAMGKPRNFHKGDVADSVKHIRYFAGLVENIHGQTSLNSPGYFNFTYRQPYGIVAAIVPWNFPTYLFVLESVPAIGAGNAIILKTSEKSPLSGVLLAQLAKSAGIPDGILNAISGDGSTGQLLSSHMQIRKISFTGSTRAGRSIMQAASQSNLKAVSLELGGKSPTLVFDDADVKAAADASAFSITLNSGQVCTASSRIYVQKGIALPFKEALAKSMATMKHGDPMNMSTILGPQADATQTDTVLSYLDIGKKDGKILIGGKLVGNDSNFIEPTIITDVPDASRVNTEEVFGPVVIVHTFDNEDDAIRRANDTEYGLYASVFTKDNDRAIRVSQALEAGNVGVNTTSPYLTTDIPFGGFKQSGIGRQKGVDSVMKWTEEKSVYMKYKL